MACFASIDTMSPERLLKQKVLEYSTIYLDMDSFFASVEQYYQPSLRGKPVGVATGPGMGASLVAASYDAKARGIKTGTKVARALELCPGLRVVQDKPELYRKVHREFMAILHDTICQVQPKGIDEAYLKVPSYAQNKEDVFTLVKAIKASIYKMYNEHICCSIGVASNVWLAKQAASSNKPRGFVCIEAKDLPAFYAGKKLTSLTGVGDRMARQFAGQQIYTPANLYAASWPLMSRCFGVNGQKWYLRMRGYEVDLVQTADQKSLGHQVTMAQYKPSSLVEITTFILKICNTLAGRLRNKKLKAQSASVSLVFVDHTYWHNKIEKLKAFDSDQAIKAHCLMLLKKLDFNKQVLRISITLYQLTGSTQLELSEPVGEAAVFSLDQSVDALHSRFSKRSVLIASTFYERSISLDRVGFAGDLLLETANPTDVNS